jgi:hypothetical protein
MNITKEAEEMQKIQDLKNSKKWCTERPKECVKGCDGQTCKGK